MELVFTRTFHFCQNVTIERLLQFLNIFLKDLVSFLYTKQMNADFFQPTINFTELTLATLAAWVHVCLSQPGPGGGAEWGMSGHYDEQGLGPGNLSRLPEPLPRNEVGKWRLTGGGRPCGCHGRKPRPGHR